MDLEYLPTIDQEKVRYDSHNNSDVSYETYMQETFKLINKYFPVYKSLSSHLDYGCGVNPLMSDIFIKNGQVSDYYDPIYHPNPSVFEKSYDVITVIETAEHFHYPNQEWKKLNQLLNPKGLIVALTKIMTVPLDTSWWYLRDNTHTTFYSNKSIEFISNMLGVEYEMLENKGFMLYGR